MENNTVHDHETVHPKTMNTINLLVLERLITLIKELQRRSIHMKQTLFR